MNVSINALILALFSVHRDIQHHERLNNDDSLEMEEREEYGQLTCPL